MRKLFTVPLLAGVITATALPVVANAQYVTVESSRVCRDSDGDRIPCGRRYYRDRDDDRRIYRERYRDRDRDDGVAIGISPRGVYVRPY